MSSEPPGPTVEVEVKEEAPAIPEDSIIAEDNIVAEDSIIAEDSIVAVAAEPSPVDATPTIPASTGFSKDLTETLNGIVRRLTDVRDKQEFASPTLLD
jgi:hypothetical protein